MKKVYYLLIAILLFPSSIISQPVTLDWVKHFTGDASSRISDLEIDDHGNLYIIGNFGGSVDFDPGTAVNSLTSVFSTDGFISKLDSNGNLIWLRHLKGGANVVPRDLELINGSQLSIFGDFSDSLNINLSTNALPIQTYGNREIFELNLDTNGNFLSVSKYDGSSFSNAVDLAYRTSNSIKWEIGHFGDTIFNRGVPIYSGGQTTSIFFNGGQEKVLNGDGFVIPWDAELTNDGSLVVIGNYNKKIYPPFPLTPSDTLESTGFHSTFIYKQNTLGDAMWLKGMRGNFTVTPRKILHDPIDPNITNRPPALLIAGSFIDSADLDPDTTSLIFTADSGSGAGFLQKLDTSGHLIWVKTFEKSSISNLTTDDEGNIYLTGSFSDTVDLDPSVGVAQLVGKGASNFFLLKLDSAGDFQWAFGIGGGTQFNNGTSDIKLRNNSIYLSGTFQDTVDFDPSTANNILVSQNGTIDMFLLKFSPSIVGLDESILSDRRVNLYPNPSADLIKIDNNQGRWNSLFVLDLQGRIVFSQENLNSGVEAINVSDLPNGTYLMRFEGEDMSTIEKFVVER